MHTVGYYIAMRLSIASYTMDFPGGSVLKKLPQSLGLGRSSGIRNGNPFQYSCLENPTDRGAWQATAQGSRSQTQLNAQSTSCTLCHVRMWELDHKEGWVLKNWCFWIVVLEKTLESPLDCKEIKPVNPKGSQAWIFTGRTDSEPEATILESRLIGKNLNAGKDWTQKKRAAEDKMVRRHHWLNG